MKVSIYKLCDPRDLECKPKYIGITTKSLKDRLKRHLDYHKLIGNSYKQNWIKSLLKENITPVIYLVQECNNINEGYELEKYWISKFTKEGYKLVNSTLGGEGTLGNKLKPEHKLKIINSLVGRKHSEETKRIMSISAKKYLKTNPRTGEYRRIPILQFDLNNNFIKEYLYIKEAIELNNKNWSSGSISKCCNREFKQAYGYIWKYKDNNMVRKKNHSFKNPSKLKKVVLQFSLSYKFIQKFNSIKEAAQSLNLTYESEICKNCNNKLSKAHGYIWKYETDIKHTTVYNLNDLKL